MDRELNENQTKPGPSGTNSSGNNSSNNIESASNTNTTAGNSSNNIGTSIDNPTRNGDLNVPNRRYTSFGTQVKVITPDGGGYFWKFENQDDDDSDDEPEIFPLTPGYQFGGKKAPRRQVHLQRAGTNTRSPEPVINLDDSETSMESESSESPEPASIFDYPNRQQNNNNNEFPNQNYNHESSNEDEYAEPHGNILCRRCNRIYLSGTLFVRTICGHLTCLTCMWEYAINYGKNNCPICGAVIDYMDSVHVEDLPSGQLKFRKNN